MNSEENKIFKEIGCELGRLAASFENQSEQICEIKEYMEEKVATKDDMKGTMEEHVRQKHDFEKQVGHVIVKNKDTFTKIMLVTITVVLSLLGIKLYLP